MSLKRELTEMLEDSQEFSSQFSQTPPPKKRKLSISNHRTPILSPPSSCEHNHHRHIRRNDQKIPIIRCKSGHAMQQQHLSSDKILECANCGSFITKNDDYYQCPKNKSSDSLCIECWDKEKSQYTGSIRLGQRVRINIDNEWKLGSILKHWPDDDMYTIQLDGQHRDEAEAYDIYDSHWNVQLVENGKLKPTPTRILTRGDTVSSIRTVPRCLSGCRMHTMDADTCYDQAETETTNPKKLNFDSNDEDDDDQKERGIFCDKCGQFIKSQKIYHCPNGDTKTHSDGYDLCLKCSKNMTKKPPIMNEYNLNGLAHFIQSNKCKKIAILCGAGISREAGIPDFRSANGIYESLSKDLDRISVKYGMTMKQKRKIKEDAQYVFCCDLFEENPGVLLHVLSDILNKRCRPTLTHCFFKLLQDRGLLRYIFTQNVDGLERYIGINPKCLIEVHGTFLTASCYECNAERPISEVREAVKRKNIPIKCEKDGCDGYVKPDCVLFGQDLPKKYYDAVELFQKNKEKIDLLIVVGTSLSVTPISRFPNQINVDSIRAVFNLDLGKEIKQIFKFGASENKRDMFVGGKCDETITALCELLGWGKELKALYKESNDLAKKIENTLNEMK